MIGRDKIQELISIQAVDQEITARQSRLNEIMSTLEPQILTEEIVELRSHRTALEEAIVDEVVKTTGCERVDAKVALIQHNWDAEEAKALLMKEGCGEGGTTSSTPA